MKAMGVALKEARIKRGMTQEDACYALRDLVPDQYRVTQGSLARIESGAIVEPDEDSDEGG